MTEITAQERRSFTDWVIEREEKNLGKNPELKKQLSDLLKNNPERILNTIKENMDGLAMSACMDGLIVSIYDFNETANKILEKFKVKFILE
jgi:hypothetical protein